jgi:hypothetical protein
MINMSDPENENVTLHFKNTKKIYFYSLYLIERQFFLLALERLDF